MKRLLVILIGCTMLGSLFGCTPPTSTTAPEEPCQGKVLTIGDIGDDVDDITSGDLPLANYLAEHLAGFGYECGRVEVSATVDEMINAIKNQEVDIYMDSMYPATLVKIETGAQPILRRWRNCDPDYYSVIFALADSGIATLEDLQGKMIGMDRSYSTSGFVVPAAFLIDHGLDLVVKDSYDDPVGVNATGVFFSLDDINTLDRVQEGKVSAGATDDYYFNKWSKEDPGKLVKIAETESVPRQVVLLRPDLETGLKEAIKKLLLAASLDPAGAQVLEQSAQTCKFDDAQGEIEVAFDRMLQMHELIQQIPGWLEAFEKGF